MKERTKVGRNICTKVVSCDSRWKRVSSPKRKKESALHLYNQDFNLLHFIFMCNIYFRLPLSMGCPLEALQNSLSRFPCCFLSSRSTVDLLLQEQTQTITFDNLSINVLFSLAHAHLSKTECNEWTAKYWYYGASNWAAQIDTLINPLRIPLNANIFGKPFRGREKQFN